jgi:hypothetical protein
MSLRNLLLAGMLMGVGDANSGGAPARGNSGNQ